MGDESVSDQKFSKLCPVYRVFEDYRDIGAAYTGKGTVSRNLHFSFQRPSSLDPSNISAHFRSNLEMFAHNGGFDYQNLTLPNGAWPHSGEAIKAEDYMWTKSTRTGIIMPITNSNEPVTYDAIVTKSTKYVLAAQGADCPQIFFLDPVAKVVGIAHAGWKPLVRGVVQKTVEAMRDLGVVTQNVLAYISPGAGDEYNVFNWDAQMEHHIRKVFMDAERPDLLQDQTIRHRLSAEEKAKLSKALGRDIAEGATSFRLSALAFVELQRNGLLSCNISLNTGSTIVDQYSDALPHAQPMFKFHSYRREKPDHGLSIGVIFLKLESKETHTP